MNKILFAMIINVPLIHAAHAALLPEYVAVVPNDAGPDLLRQCSRRSVENVESYWQPSTRQIRELEERLPAFLKKKDVRAPGQPLQEYYRQYVGVVAKGHKLIYGNFFHEKTYQRTAKRESPDYWKTKVVGACDGGDYFWGIIYDPKRGSFEKPEYNGEA